MKARSLCLMTLLSASASAAFASDGWEVTLLGGWTAPTLEERVVFGVLPAIPELPPVSFDQQGELALVGRGSFAFGGAVAYFFGEHVALEARVDTVDFQVETEGPLISGTAPLPAPLPSIEATLDLTRGAVNVERLHALSANLKARTGGEVAFVVSGGVSLLPRLGFTARQEASLSVDAPVIGTVPVATVAAEADALSDVPFEDRFGFNGGAGVDVRLSESVSFVGEARVFLFPTQTLSWRPATVTGTELEALLLEELLEELEPVELELKYFQVSAGIALRF